MKNRYSALTLQDESTMTLLSANSRYEHFVLACKEIAGKVIPLKSKQKKRNPWETHEVCENRTSIQQTARLKDNQPTTENIRNCLQAQNILVNSYEEEETQYFQNKINEINNAVSNTKSALSWKAVNEVSGRKKSNKGNIKATSDIERIQKWHNNFSELLGSTTEQPNSNNNVHTISEYKPKILDI